jgi:hypothetical protein
VNDPVKFKQWLPAMWIAMAGVILAADYFIGSAVSVTILFVVPVALAARYNGRWWGSALGAMMPLVHFGCTLLWRPPIALADQVIDAGIRIAVLVAFAVLIDRTTRLAREIKVLRGLLPVCSFCRKVRTEAQDWPPMETYIAAHSEASFTHTFCPACAQEHYGSYLNGPASGQTAAPADAPVTSAAH